MTNGLGVTSPHIENEWGLAGGGRRSGQAFRAGKAPRGATIFKMMDVSRHRSVDTLRGYVRDAELFKDHALDLVLIGGQ
jgi:hypothetical protein